MRFGSRFWQVVATGTNCHLLYQVLKLLQVIQHLIIMNRAMSFWGGTQGHTKCMFKHFKHLDQFLNKCTFAPLAVVWTGCPWTPAVCKCVFSPCDTSLCHWFGNTFSWCLSVQDLETMRHIQIVNNNIISTLLTYIASCTSQRLFLSVSIFTVYGIPFKIITTDWETIQTLIYTHRDVPDWQ